MTEFRERIARFLYQTYGTSSPGFDHSWDTESSMHQDEYLCDATELMKLMGMRGDRVGTLTRYVTDWFSDDTATWRKE